MKNLALPIGIFFVAVLAGVVLVVLPSKSQAPTTVDPHADLIVVDSPIVSSTTITVTGKARGTWYFEASFPIEVRDAPGRLVGQGVAQAQEDWMTTEFVPFKATITLTEVLPSGMPGTLVLKKDNPSGLPEHDDSIEVPIVF